MSKKEVFDVDISDMTLTDDSLNINEIFAAQPAIEDETGKKEDSKEDDKEGNKEEDEKNKQDPSIDKSIDSILEEIESSKDKEEDEEKKDDEVPASKQKDVEKFSSSDAPFTIIFARDLEKQGLLSSFNEENFIKSIEEKGEAAALRGLIQDEVDSNIKAVKKDLDAGYQNYLEMVGKGVAPEDAGNLLGLKERFDSIDADKLEEDDSSKQRREVIGDYFRLTTQMSDSKIKEMVDRSFDMGNDVEDSKDYLKTLQTLVKNNITQQEEAAEEQKEQLEQVKQQRLEELKDGINAINEIIPGQKVNKQTKQEMYDLLIKPVQDKDGRTTNAIWAARAEDPMFFDSRLAYLLQTGYFVKGKPWNKIKSIKTSKEASELEDYLSGKKNTDSRSGYNLDLTIKDNKTIKDIITSTGSIL